MFPIIGFIKQHKRLSIGLGIVLAIALIRFLNLRNQPLKVETSRVERGNLVETVSTSGKVKADQFAELTFQSSGQVAWVGVKVGDKVLKGQAIASLNTMALSVAYQQALNTYRDKQAAAENAVDSVKNHSSDETFAQKATRTAAEAARDNAYDSVRAAEQALKFATIRAPFDGIISDVNPSSAGVNVTPATSSYTIVNPDTIYFDAEVEETDLPRVNLGQKAQIKLDAYPNETFESEVANIGLIAFTSTTGGNAYKVRIFMPKNENLKFKVGMEGDINIIFKTLSDVLKVPASAIVNDSGKDYVWIVTNGQAKRVEVTTGDSSADETEIKSGVTEGDTVINEPSTKLKGGQNVGI